ncbi:MAG: S49 family peptidase, partial [Inhella sp.]
MNADTPQALLPDPTPQPQDMLKPAAAPAAAASHEALALQLARDYLVEKRSERRWRMLLRSGWLLLAAFIVWTRWSQHLVPAPPGAPHTALVELRGEIA